jgi:hypothetical protein
MDELPEPEAIADRIIVVRAQRVMLDADLAVLYGVPTKRLNQQVRRNPGRFPADFAFQLRAAEWTSMNRLQIASGLRRTNRANQSQFATGSQKHRGPAALPLAFTEHGCLMLANVLRSGRAVEVSVLIVRAFVRMRSAVAASTELAARTEELAREVERHGGKLATHDAAILKILAEIRRLTQFPESPRRGIGFTAEWPEGK